MKKLQQVLMLAVCLLILMVAAVQRDGKLWGHSLKAAKADSLKTARIDTMRTLDDGTKVINTTMLGKDITGYGGAVPLEIYVKDNKIVKVKALKNAETPEFFAETKPLLAKWNGKTIDEALRLKVDAVSGATFSSRGIIGNMRRGLAYASQKAVEPSILEQMDLNAKTVSALLVVLLGAIVPLFYRNKHYRTVQLLLNAVVLGFGCGTFLSWSLFVNFVSSGINFWASLVPVLMLVTAFVYPLFARRTIIARTFVRVARSKTWLRKRKTGSGAWTERRLKHSMLPVDSCLQCCWCLHFPAFGSSGWTTKCSLPSSFRRLRCLSWRSAEFFCYFPSSLPAPIAASSALREHCSR